MAVRTIKDLEKKIQKSIKSALENEVFETIQKEQLSQIQEKVYNAYNPTTMVYERRYSNGGLMDEGNIKGNVKAGVLTVENKTPPNPEARDGATIDKNLIEVIETGNGYDYSPNPGARPFIDTTKQALEASNAIVEALKDGLKKQGAEVI